MKPLSVFLLCALLGAPAAAAQDDLLIDCVDAFPGQKPFQRPVWIAFHGSDPGHGYVVEQTGKVWRVPLEGDAERRLVLDLSAGAFHPENKGHNEEGLLGFAFDPDFTTTGHVFVYYSERTGEEPYTDRKGKQRTRYFRRSVLARMDAVLGDEAKVDPDSELRLLEVEQPWGNHNGGTITFGPDRMLYIALGDGGARADRGGNGQNLATLLGSILRIDVRNATADVPYAIPADNPFVGRDGMRGEIWAYGLRNPWRMAFDRDTGELWCGDVGQDKWEEVDHIVRGGNYGWPLREGLHEFPPGRDASDDPEGLIDPIAEYPHSTGISITGGHVYRGKRIPALVGRYVYGDFATLRLWATKREADPEDADQVVDLGRAVAPLASFAEGPDGEIYVLCFDGRIYALVPAQD